MHCGWQCTVAGSALWLAVHCGWQCGWQCTVAGSALWLAVHCGWQCGWQCTVAGSALWLAVHCGWQCTLRNHDNHVRGCGCYAVHCSPMPADMTYLVHIHPSMQWLIEFSHNMILNLCTVYGTGFNNAGLLYCRHNSIQQHMKHSSACARHL